METVNLTVGRNIERLRAARGLTRYGLAKELGTDWPVVWRWETGRRMPDPFYLLRISYVLHCTVEAIFQGVVAAPDGWRVEPPRAPAA